jgi:choline dehydrogenase-like flavoprotein
MLSYHATPARDGLSADVVIIGHGLVGTVAARCLLAAGASVIVIDAGSPASVPPGGHLRNLAACAADRSFYHALAGAHLRPVSIPRQPGKHDVPAMPDGNGVNGLQRPELNMPAASSTNLLGGMGTVWNGVSLRLDPERERWPGISPAAWSDLYERAEAILCVGLAASAGSARQDFLLRTLATVPDARPIPAPVAARRLAGHPPALRWTGPAEILAGAVQDPRPALKVLAQHAVCRLRHRGGRVIAADAVDLGTAARKTISADAFLVAAGAIRTPALLWASAILTDDGADSPVGRYLCDHPLAYAQIVLDPAAIAGDRDRSDPDPFVVVPPTGERPFHSLLLCDGYDTRVLEGRIDDRLILSMYWYVQTKPRFENRVAFSDRSTDALGLPQATFEYALSSEERQCQRAAVEDIRSTGKRLGTFLPGSPPRSLSPGSSMHVMGTTRMGQENDGQTVTDIHGRVWGFENLYLGGTGLIPAATVTNPTLAACALAILSADRMSGR